MTDGMIQPGGRKVGRQVVRADGVVARQLTEEGQLGRMRAQARFQALEDLARVYGHEALLWLWAEACWQRDAYMDTLANIAGNADEEPMAALAAAEVCVANGFLPYGRLMEAEAELRDAQEDIARLLEHDKRMEDKYSGLLDLLAATGVDTRTSLKCRMYEDTLKAIAMDEMSAAEGHNPAQAAANMLEAWDVAAGETWVAFPQPEQVAEIRARAAKRTVERTGEDD